MVSGCNVIVATTNLAMRTGGHPKSNNTRPWSAEHEATLIELREAGKPTAVIARALGRSKAACQARWYKIKKARDARDQRITLGRRVE